jgi:hypothetical protein
MYTVMVGEDDDGSLTILGVFDDRMTGKEIDQVRRQIEEWGVPNVKFYETLLNPTPVEALQRWSDDWSDMIRYAREVKEWEANVPVP